MKKFLSVVLSVALAIGIMPMNALAEGVDRAKNAESSEAVVTSERSHWAADVADRLASEGIISDELVEMASNLDGRATRAQAVSLLIKSVKIELAESNPKEKDNADDSTVENQIKLSDISGHWAEEYILAAVAAGYVNGYPDGTFRPDDTITRAEIAKITAVVLGLKASENASNPFTDLSESDWEYEYVLACAENGLLKGYEDGSFRADGKITCGESIAVTERAHEAAEHSAQTEVKTEAEPVTTKAKPSGSSSSSGSSTGVSSSGGGNLSGNVQSGVSGSTSGQTVRPLGVASSVWDGSIANSFAGGTGTEEDPYQIATGAQLAYLAQKVNAGTSYSGEYFKLTSDIVLNDTSNWESWNTQAPANSWTAIGRYIEVPYLIKDAATFSTAESTYGRLYYKSSYGNYSYISSYKANYNTYYYLSSFKGTFDGDGHVVRGIYINTEANYQGLFGFSSGTVKNVGVVESYISSSSSSSSSHVYVGGVVGYNQDGTVSDCYNTGTVTGTSTGEYSSVYVGGVIGDNYGTVSDCYNTGAVTGSSDYVYVGGVVGRNLGSGTVSACYNTDEVTGTGNRSAVYVGGVVGQNSGTVEDCYNTGNVSGNGTVGGVVGSGRASNCYNTGTISGTGKYVNVGGVVGSGSANNCHNTGNVAGTATNDTYGDDSDAYVGGVIGYGSVSNSYNTGDVTGTANSYIYGNGISSAHVGGVAGDGYTVSGCYNMGNVTSTTTGSYNSAHVGGVVGDGDKVSDCYNAGVVFGTATGGVYVGGVSGYSEDTLGECYNTGLVSGNGRSSYIGGVVGYNKSGTVSNSYNMGDMTGTTTGSNGSMYIGGVVGRNSSGTVRNCYNMGDMTDTTTGSNSYAYIGGVVGLNNSGTVSNCYFLSETANEAIGMDSGTSENVGSRTEVEMKTNDFAAMLNNGNELIYWAIEDGENNNYPILFRLLDCERFGHYWYDEWTVDLAATETTTGIKSRHCVRKYCNEKTDITVIPTRFTGGSGTEADPYQIATSEQLEYLAQQVNNGKSYSNTYFKLISDIELNDTSNWDNWGDEPPKNIWTPIGADTIVNKMENPFSGVFDGNGYTIKGLYGEGGLFGDVYNAQITSVNVEGYIIGTGYIGGIVDCLGGTIANCKFSGKIVGTGNGGYIGGIASNTNNYANIINCMNMADISSNGNYIGGIVGYSNALVVSCENIGNILGWSYVGGIVGAGGSYWGSEGTEKNCINKGNVSASHNYAGGIVGSTWGSLINCVNIGYITSNYGKGAITESAYGSSKLENLYFLNNDDIAIMNGNHTYSSIKNSSAFNEQCVLTDSVTAGEYTGTDLLSALNGWVNAQGTLAYLKWKKGEDGYPTLDFDAAQMSGLEAAEEIRKLDNKKSNWFSKLFDPIDLATGAQIIDLTFLSQSSALELGVEISYNSLLLESGFMGKGWTHNYEISLDLTNSNAPVINWNSNRANEFTKISDGKFEYSDNYGTVYELTAGSGRYTLKTKEKISYIFDTDGVLTKISDRNGNSLIFEYTDGKLSKISDSLTGKYIAVVYNSDGLISTFGGANGYSVSFEYTDGIISKITDEAGTVREYTYNELGQVLTGKVNGTLIFSNTYDANGRIIAQDDGIDGNEVSTISYREDLTKGTITTTVTDRNGNKQVRVHNSKYQLISATDALGATLTYEYDSNGNQTSITDSLGRKVSYKYDTNGNITEITDVAGNKTLMEYDGNGNIEKVTAEDGTTNIYTYDPNGNLLTSTDELSKITRYEYDEKNQLISVTTPNEGTSTIEYNDNGTIKSQTDAAGIKTQYEYYTDGRLKTVTNPSGDAVSYEYDAKGNVTKITDATGSAVKYEYDYYGNITKYTDADGNIWKYEYDLNHNIVKSVNPNGGYMTYEYDGEGQLIACTDERGAETKMELDKVGNIVRITDALGNSTRYEYDKAYRVTAVYDAEDVKVAAYTYDAYDNILTVTDALGNITSYTYDSYGRLASEKDPLNNETVYTYDLKSRLCKATDPYGTEYSIERDDNGNVVRVNDGLRDTVSYAYDIANRVTSQSTAGGSTIRYSYDLNGRLSVVTNGRNQSAAINYDAAGRIAELELPEEKNVSYAYDARGNLIKISDGKDEITREYDSLGRVTKYRDADGNVLLYGYDAVGNLTEITYPDGKTVSYTYDLAGQLTEVTDWDNRQTKYTYDANGRLIKTERPDGSVLVSEYDDNGRLISQTDKAASGVVIYEVEFEYDAAGRIISEEGTAEAYIYYAPERSMTYGEGNALLTYNGNSVITDADGNITELPLRDGTLEMTYDYANRMKTAGAYEYEYDLEGNRVSVKNGAGTTSYIVNPSSGLSQVLVREKPDGSKTYYVYGLGLIGEQSESGYRAYHFDCRGSTVAITTEDGAVSDTVTYTPFGEVAEREGETDTPFLYCGAYGVQTDGNGLLYMRARYYSPEIGRFVSQDTVIGSIGIAGSLNRYAYCGGNPISYVDPEGEFGILATMAIGAIVGATASGLVDIYSQWRNKDSINWRKAGIAAGSGAVVGAISVLGTGAAIAANVVASGATSVIDDVYFSNETYTSAQIATHAVGSAIIGGISSGIGEGFSKVLAEPTYGVKIVNVVTGTLKKVPYSYDITKRIVRTNIVKAGIATIPINSIMSSINSIFDK